MKRAIVKRLNDIERKLLKGKELILRTIEPKNDKFIITQSTIKSEIGKEFVSMEEIEKLPNGIKHTIRILNNLLD